MQPSTSPLPKAMRIAESKQRLLDMLNQHGDVATAGRASTLLDVFLPFARIPAEDAAPIDEDGDGILAQFGSYDFRGRPEFQVDLTRQFIEPNEDPVMWQLHCTMYWASTPETDALGSGDLWSFGLDLDQFFAQVRALPGWAWALHSGPSIPDFEVSLEEA